MTPFLFGGVGGSTTVDNNQPIQDMLAFAKLLVLGLTSEVARGGLLKQLILVEFTQL